MHLLSPEHESAAMGLCLRLNLKTRDRRVEFVPTWRGDAGFTDLLDRKDVPKYDLRVEALGTLDEVSSALGIARAKAMDETTRALLLGMQSDLCYMMSEVAGYETNGTGHAIDATRIAWLEARLQELQREAPWTQGFIAPGDTVLGADLQMARAITRRAERLIAHLTHADQLENPCILAYLNRLAYVLFALARVAEQRGGVSTPTLAKSE